MNTELRMLMNNLVFKTSMENVAKLRDKTCNRRIKKKLDQKRVTTKLSCYKVFHRKFVSNKNQENPNMHE